MVHIASVPRYLNEAQGGVQLALEGLSLDSQGVVKLEAHQRRFLMQILIACRALLEQSKTAELAAQHASA